MPFLSEPASRRGPSVLAACAAAAVALLAAPFAAAAVAPHPLVEVPFFDGQDVQWLAIATGEPARIYAVADFTLYVSEDAGASWQFLHTPSTVSGGVESTVRAIAVHPWVDGLVFASVVTHLARSTDGGTSWQEIGTSCISPETYGFGISDPDRYYASGPAWAGSCFRFPSSGCGLHRGDGSAPTECVSAEPTPVIANALVVDPRDADRVLAGNGRGVFRSEEAGETWTLLSAEISPTVFVLHPGDPDVVFAGTFGDGLWRSDDFGDTWTRIDEGLFTDEILDLEIDPVDPSTLHAITGFREGVWTSRDGGATWQAQWSGLPEGMVNDIALAPGDPGVLLIATDEGLYRRQLVDDRPCVADANTLCLLDGRVRVQVAWRAFDGSTGLGAAVPQTGETGWFWFFDEENPELVVKALDGREVNGHLWLFYGSLTNVEMTITATDTLGGEIESFYNPPRRFASAGHTAVFARPVPLRAPAGGAAVSSTAPAAWAPPLALADPVPAVAPAHGGSCADSAALCLHDRFRVTVEWEDFFGNTGQGVPLPLTEDAGFFWFFEAGNLELVVKVLDAEAVNGHWWVFYGALTNVAYTLRVEDTATGLVREYENPLRHFGSLGDTAAFPAGEVP